MKCLSSDKARITKNAKEKHDTDCVMSSTWTLLKSYKIYGGDLDSIHGNIIPYSTCVLSSRKCLEIHATSLPLKLPLIVCKVETNKVFYFFWFLWCDEHFFIQCWIIQGKSWYVIILHIREVLRRMKINRNNWNGLIEKYQIII